MNIKESLQGAYLDWFNNYLTIEKYAEHNQISIESALKVIEAGKEAHESIVQKITETEIAVFVMNEINQENQE